MRSGPIRPSLRSGHRRRALLYAAVPVVAACAWWALPAGPRPAASPAVRAATPTPTPTTTFAPTPTPAPAATPTATPTVAAAPDVAAAVEALVERFRATQDLDPALPLERAYALREEATAALAREFAPLGAAAVPELERRLQGLRDRPLGKLLVAALEAIGGAEALDALAAQATGAEDFVIRELALRALVEAWPDGAKGSLWLILESEVDRRVRLVALELAAPRLDESDTDWVLAYLERDPGGAEEALRVLVRADTPAVWAIVRRIVEGPASEALRRAALAVLVMGAAGRGDAGLAAVSRVFSADEPVEVRLAAVDALLAAGTEGALDVLVRIAAYDPEPSVRERTERAVEALRRQLANPGRTVPLVDPELTPASLPDRGGERRPPVAEKPMPR